MAKQRLSKGFASILARACAVVVGTMLIVGCAMPEAKSTSATEASAAGVYSMGEEEGIVYGGDSDTEGAAAQDNAMENGKAPAEEESKAVVIKSGNVRLESRKYDEALEAVKTIVKDAEGNVTNSNESGGKQRSITIEARVDPAKLDETIEKLRNVKDCTVLNASVSSDDVTRTYNDTERRIEILNQQYDHYKKMLESATTTEDMLNISDRMYEVMAEIKSYTDARDEMDHASKHSLLVVTLEEEVAAGSSSQSAPGNFAEDAWDDSWGMFGEVLRGLVYVLILLLPYLLVAAVVVAIVIAIRRRKRKTKKDVQEPQEPQDGGPKPPEDKSVQE